MKRSIHPMPDFVREALTRHKVFEAYLARPAYQRNDYIGWINRAAREDTKHRRLGQMIDELKNGGVYMKMKYTSKADPGTRSGEPRGTPGGGKAASRDESVDDYIGGFPPETRQALTELREAIRTEAPEAKEKMSYGMPTFFLKGNLVHFAAYKNHIGFYPAPSGIEVFEKELAPYRHSKGSVQFPLDSPLPLDLIRRITRFRREENDGSKA